jgi:hypothetical protein
MLKENAPPESIQSHPEYDNSACELKGVKVNTKDGSQKKVSDDHRSE